MEKILAKFKDPQRTDTQNITLLWMLLLVCFVFGQFFVCLNVTSYFVLLKMGVSNARAELIALLMQWLVNALALTPVVYYATYILTPKKQ